MPTFYPCITLGLILNMPLVRYIRHCEQRTFTNSQLTKLFVTNENEESRFLTDSLIANADHMTIVRCVSGGEANNCNITIYQTKLY